MRNQSLEYFDWAKWRHGLQKEFGERSIDCELVTLVPEAHCLVPREGPTVMDANVGHFAESSKGTGQRPEAYRVGLEPDASEPP